MKHCQTNGFSVVYNPAKALIWCYECDDGLDQMVDILRLNDDAASIQKAMEIQEYTDMIKSETGLYMRTKNEKL